MPHRQCAHHGRLDAVPDLRALHCTSGAIGSSKRRGTIVAEVLTVAHPLPSRWPTDVGLWFNLIAPAQSGCMHFREPDTQCAELRRRVYAVKPLRLAFLLYDANE
jgi:hypothetical protein